ncbi:MAG: NAD(P)-dependent oxidoreductase [Thermoanaerobaculia bacterium]|nr:NAD(P)-dependent oxidoreductase [Thermoanaerobaculia bacterium]
MENQRLVVTGASGFIGRHLLAALAGRTEVHAVARRSPALSGAPAGPGIHWHQADIARPAEVEAAFAAIRAGGGAGTLFHLAGHYDFTGRRDPAYQATNVDGMRHVLDAAREIGVERVIFTSSLAACAFPPQGELLRESSPPDGDTPYAESKRAGEEMLREYRGALRSTVVRFAAIYSDWCEYEPVFHFLEQWLSESPTRRVLAGRGRSAVPYLHVRDAVDFLLHLLAHPDRTADGEVVIGSPDGATSHRELFAAATAAHHGRRQRPLCVPRPLCRLALPLRDAAGRLAGRRPFERPWMGRMIDLALAVDTSRTRARLGWEPRPRLAILRRLPFLVENRKTYPGEWLRRNHARRLAVRRDNLLLHGLLEARAAELEAQLTAPLLAAAAAGAGGWSRLDPTRLADLPRALLEALGAAVRTGEKGRFVAACRAQAVELFAAGVSLDELWAELERLGRACHELFAAESRDANWPLALHDHLQVTVQFGIDEIQDVHEGVDGRQAP